MNEYSVPTEQQTLCVSCYKKQLVDSIWENAELFNPLTPELNSSAQRCKTRFFTGDFAS
jgi:hypothetical protein